MIKEKDFKKNVKAILDAGAIENIPIKQLNILKNISKDKNLMHLFFLEFEHHFPYEDGIDMLLCKTQDFIYRLDMAINDWLIPKYNLDDNSIKSTLMDLIFDDIDLYSAVNYDDSDLEIIEEYNDLLPSDYIKL